MKACVYCKTPFLPNSTTAERDLHESNCADARVLALTQERDELRAQVALVVEALRFWTNGSALLDTSSENVTKIARAHLDYVKGCEAVVEQARFYLNTPMHSGCDDCGEHGGCSVAATLLALDALKAVKP